MEFCISKKSKSIAIKYVEEGDEESEDDDLDPENEEMALLVLFDHKQSNQP